MLFLSATFLLRRLWLRLQDFEIVVEPIEALLPQAAIAFEPVVNAFQRGRFEPAGPPLRLAAARDQAGVFQHLEMLGDGGRRSS